LYPTEETEVNVKLDFEGTLTVTYPEYPEGGWDVTAFPDGTMIEHVKGRKLYTLFWEGETKQIDMDNKHGFVVHNSRLNEFFEEKLKTIGMNWRESEEFIIDVVPMMLKNEYTFIHFCIDNWKKTAGLKVTPKPDTEIRFLVQHHGVPEDFNVIE